ncbi:hypothetical protein LEN26_012213 [Aphanomyces euteiches]|nr:hypothetical protein LEN26_012213 [Aphanomyces euteiches]
MEDKAKETTRNTAKLRVLCVETSEKENNWASSQLNQDCNVRTYCPTTSLWPSKEDLSSIVVQMGVCFLFVIVGISMLTVVVLDYWYNDVLAAYVVLAAFAFIVLLLISVVLELIDAIQNSAVKRHRGAVLSLVQEFKPSVLVGCGYGGQIVVDILSQPKSPWDGPSVVIDPTNISQAQAKAIERLPVWLATSSFNEEFQDVTTLMDHASAAAIDPRTQLLQIVNLVHRKFLSKFKPNMHEERTSGHWQST